MKATGAVARPGRGTAPGAGSPGRRRGERGTTLVEVMIAGLILLVALLGFAGMAATSATSTGVAHRRGTAVYMESALVDRYLVQTRTTYAMLPANTWVLDTCYDVYGQPLGASNTTYSTSFTCPAGAYYRTWVRISGSGPWGLSVYAERIDPGCDPTARYSSLACVAADVSLTD
jgi:Tfp pilus assembly protein PilV